MAKPALPLLHDENPAAHKLGEMLRAFTPLESLNLFELEPPAAALGGAMVVCLGHRALRKFDALRTALGLPIDHAIFIAPADDPQYAPIFADMGVTDYFTAPVDLQILWRAVNAAQSGAVEASWRQLPPIRREALIASRRTFRKLFDGIRDGEPPDMGDIARTSEALCAAMKDGSLAEWLSALKGHHDHTYRHCLIVSGILLHFAWDMGVQKEDLTLLATAGLLHDVGKALIPQRILDKPTALNADELEEMKKHPGFSRDIIEGIPDLDKRVAAMAVHHHDAARRDRLSGPPARPRDRRPDAAGGDRRRLCRADRRTRL